MGRLSAETGIRPPLVYSAGGGSSAESGEIYGHEFLRLVSLWKSDGWYRIVVVGKIVGFRLCCGNRSRPARDRFEIFEFGS